MHILLQRAPLSIKCFESKYGFSVPAQCYRHRVQKWRSANSQNHNIQCFGKPSNLPWYIKVEQSILAQ